MFICNKYFKVYYSIIDRARTRDSLDYCEAHHIIPKSLGGTNDPSNIVKLTPREHYICHALLPKMCSNTNHIHKMYAAFNMMHVNNNGKRYNGHLYEFYKIKFYKLHSEQQKGKIVSKETRDKQSKKRKGVPWSEKARTVQRNKPTAKPVLVYKKDSGEFIGEWESISLCAKELNLDTSSVWKICKGDWTSIAPDGKVRPYKSHRGYTFRYKQ